jgi:hypothetical protein
MLRQLAISSRLPDNTILKVGAFPVCILLAPEGCCVAVRPSKCLGAVVGRVDHDCVVGNPQGHRASLGVARLPVMFDHTVRVEAKTGLALRFRFEPGPDVHAGRIKPSQERFLVPIWSINEIHRVAFLVSGPVSEQLCLPHLPKRGSSPGVSTRVALYRITPRGPNRARRFAPRVTPLFSR